MATLVSKGYEIGGTVDTASMISCLDKDGNISTVQAELDKSGEAVDSQGKILNEKIEGVDARLTKLKNIYKGGLDDHILFESTQTDVYKDLFTAPESGFYFITAIVQWYGVTSSVEKLSYVNSRIHIEKLGLGGGQLVAMDFNITSSAYQQLYENVFLEKGEAVKLALRQNTGTNIDMMYRYRYSYIPIS